MNDMPLRCLFLAHVASTLMMTGVIWFVQIVHYPLFADAGRGEFSAYEQRHTARTTSVVAPLMLVEGVTALMLCWFRPVGLATWPLGTGLALVAVIWLSTALIQVPCHEVLSQGFDEVAHRRLVASNWIRTTAWSLRGLLVLTMTWHLLK